MFFEEVLDLKNFSTNFRRLSV